MSFGWASAHTYDFKIKDPIEEARREAEEAQYEHETREELVERMMQSMMLNGNPGPQTHYLLRIVKEDPHGPGGMMSGKGVDFVHDEACQHPQTPEKFSTKIRLQDVLEKSKYKDKSFAYEYDFGDCWYHEITLVGRKDSTDFFMCTDGEGHGVTEDVGSVERMEGAEGC